MSIVNPVSRYTPLTRLARYSSSCCATANYTTCQSDYYDGEYPWTNIKMKGRRPLDSLLLDEGMIESILADVREFLKVEDW